MQGYFYASIHYPLIYIYTAWVNDHKIPLRQALPVAFSRGGIRHPSRLRLHEMI
jgi:hypothetical protein